jgi:hypothetical protein
VIAAVLLVGLVASVRILKQYERACSSGWDGSRTWRNLQTMLEIGVDKNSTIVFPAPLMSTIQELGAFLSRERAAAAAG